MRLTRGKPVECVVVLKGLSYEIDTAQGKPVDMCGWIKGIVSQD